MEHSTELAGLSHIAAGFGVGIALAGAPGPVQAVLLGEALRGGVARGLRAMAGANVTFGLLLAALALGLSIAPPSGLVLRVLKVAGGALLLWLALDGFRSAAESNRPEVQSWRTLPPTVRGTLAVLLNPGAWLFLGAVASPLFAAASRDGGTPSALLTVLAMVIGLMIGDGAVVLLGGLGMRKASVRAEMWIRRALAALLAGLGVWLVVSGVVG
jgi:threonine/homoserine/homoserine lactone efflux protein